jgi:tetratricopeptide (TPR) repeat protein
MPRSEEEWIAEILRLRSADRIDDALAAGDAAISECGDTAAIRIARGRAHERARQYVAAIAEASRALELAPPEPAYYFDRARWRMMAGLFDEARADLSAILSHAHEPTREYYRGVAQLFRAFCSLELGDDQQALDDALACGVDGPVGGAGNGLVNRADLILAATRRLGGHGPRRR